VKVRALTGDEADLAEEAPCPVTGDQLLVRSEDLDRATEDDDPVVVVIGRGEQHVALPDLAALAQLEHDGQLFVVELGEGDGIGRRGRHGQARYRPRRGRRARTPLQEASS
jgi:hypothetical protein